MAIGSIFTQCPILELMHIGFVQTRGADCHTYYHNIPPSRRRIIFVQYIKILLITVLFALRLVLHQDLCFSFVWKKIGNDWIFGKYLFLAIVEVDIFEKH